MSEQEQPIPVTEQLTYTAEDGTHRLTEAGKEYIAPQVTNMDSDIFAFTPEADQLVVAASFARFSRSRDGARELIADEFAGEDGRNERFLEKVTLDYGDESVEQLYSSNVVTEGVSILLSKQIEWHRPGIAYLEKSTRYVTYDERDDEGRYKYIRPNNLSGSELEQYEATIDRIFSNYSRAVEVLVPFIRQRFPKDEETTDAKWRSTTKAKALDIARVLLPSATKTNLGIHASGQAMNNLVMRLRASDISEARWAGDKILEEVRKITPVFSYRTDRPDRGGMLSATMAMNRHNIQEAAKNALPLKPAALIKGQSVDLRRYSPEDEFELLPYMLFDEAPAGYSIEDIKDAVSRLSHEERVEIIQAYMGEQWNRRAKPGRAIEQANYTWEIVSDFGAFRDLQRHRMSDDLRWQRLTVEHGFDNPEYVAEAGLEDIYRETVELSQQLYEALIEAGKPVEAQYATLLGHKMRWTVKTNGRSNCHILQLRSTPQAHPSYRETVRRMYREVEKVHPYLARLSMQNMDLDETDDNVGRLEHQKQQKGKRR